jgi:hypothetical protein
MPQAVQQPCRYQHVTSCVPAPPAMTDGVRSTQHQCVISVCYLLLQVEQRMLAYLQDVVLPSLAPGGPPAVVVSHGFAIKCTLRGILDSSPAMTRRVGRWQAC